MIEYKSYYRNRPIKYNYEYKNIIKEKMKKTRNRIIKIGGLVALIALHTHYCDRNQKTIDKQVNQIEESTE